MTSSRTSKYEFFCFGDINLKFISIRPSLHVLKFFLHGDGTVLRNENGCIISKCNNIILLYCDCVLRSAK